MNQVEVLIAPNPPGVFTQRTVIGGVEVLFTFRFLERCAAWYMDVQTTSEEYLLQGVPMVPGLPLTYRIRDPRFPSGDLFLTGKKPETLEALGNGSCSLVYAWS